MRRSLYGCDCEACYEGAVLEIYKGMKLVSASNRARAVKAAIKKLREWTKNHPEYQNVTDPMR